LIPIITPLFFSSNACRDELGKFIAHEKAQGRDDLILPVYLVTVPELERSDSKDSLAISISKRERYDLRAKANLRIKSPQMRAAIAELSNKIASALRREPPTVQHDAGASTSVNERAKLLALQSAAELDEPAEKSKKKRRILWVDDRPNNNVFERRAMQPYGVEFELAKSTGEALAMLGKKRFDAIISDMGRPPDMEAGYTLLDVLRKSGNLIPFFIYAGSDSAQHLRLALSKGAQGSTNLPNKLIASVLESLET
jgi:CheY-like chemotaxis protein